MSTKPVWLVLDDHLYVIPTYFPAGVRRPPYAAPAGNTAPSRNTFPKESQP